MEPARAHLDALDPLLARFIDGLSARVWLGDLSAARDMYDATAAAHGDVLSYLRGHPDAAHAMYRAMVPLAWNAPAGRKYGLPGGHPADVLAGADAEATGQLALVLSEMLSGAPSGTIEVGLATHLVEQFSWVMAGPPDAPASRAFVVSAPGGVLAGEAVAAWQRSEQVRYALHGSGTSAFMLDRDMRIVWSENPRTRSDLDLRGLDITQVVGQQLGADLKAAFRPVLKWGVPCHSVFEMEGDEGPRYFDFEARPWRLPDGSIGGLVGTNIEVTEREVLMRQLAAAVVTDALTGLPNRQGLFDALEGLVAKGPTSAASALIAFDISRFQAVNDVYGEAIGDAILRRVAAVLVAGADQRDVVARFGGDRFAVVIDGDRAATTEAVVAEALRLQAIVERADMLVGDHVPVRVQVAVGALTLGGAGKDRRRASDALADLDTALIRAKRTRVVACVSAADAAAHRALAATRVRWGQRMRADLEADDVLVMAQPIVELASGATVAFELLARLRDGDRVVPGGEFMGAIDVLGMTPLLDRWMLNRAVHLLAEHADAIGGRRLSVNVGAATFTSGDLLTMLDVAVAASGADPSRLVIELTETEVMPDMQVARRVAQGLHDRGCLVALDDFGSGAAVPAYLTEFPIDWIKIDGRFVQRAPDSAIDRAIVAGAIVKADVLGIPVVAEWVEDDRAAALLLELGAQMAQGFLFAAAGPVPEVFARP